MLIFGAKIVTLKTTYDKIDFLFLARKLISIHRLIDFYLLSFLVRTLIVRWHYCIRIKVNYEYRLFSWAIQKVNVFLSFISKENTTTHLYFRYFKVCSTKFFFFFYEIQLRNLMALICNFDQNVHGIFDRLVLKFSTLAPCPAYFTQFLYMRLTYLF